MGWSNRDKAHGRDYVAENKYKAKPKQIKLRVARNKARALAIKQGKVRKGDKTKDVDHRNFNALDNKPSNVRVISSRKNRSYARTSTGKPKKAKK